MPLLYLVTWLLTGSIGISLLPTAPSWALGILAVVMLVGGLAYRLAATAGAPFTTEGPVYIASRWAHNNLIFPTQVAVLPSRVVRYKKRLIGADQESINHAQIASVKIRTRLLWSDVVIESSGGTDPLIAHGHYNTDALAIKTAIEIQQQRYYRQVTSLPRDESTRAATIQIALCTEADSTPLTTVTRPLSDPRNIADTIATLLETGGPSSYLRIYPVESAQPQP